MVKSSLKVKYNGKTYIVVGESTNSLRLTTGPETIIVPKDKVEQIKETKKDVQDAKVAKTKKSRTRKG